VGKGGKTPKASVCATFPKPDSTIGRSFEELFGHGPASCRLGEFLREEWARKARGQKSCLDLDEDDCDWTPEMFTAHYADGMPYVRARQSAENLCLSYTGGKIDQPSLGKAEDYIKTMYEKIQAAMKVLEPYKKDKTNKGWRFGKDFTDSESLGDKDWFAAGYDYDIGWEVAPVKLDEDHYDGICELTGAAHGNVGVDGWLAGTHVDVIDGEFRGRVNKDASGDSRVVGHLKIFDSDLFDPIDKTFNGTYAPTPWTDSVDIPTGFKPSFTVMAGPIPITGAIWGELFYGASFEFDEVAKAAKCNANKVKFTADGTFEPLIGLNGKAQVGVGVSGLLSAGIRGMVNLVTLGLPLEAKLDVIGTKVKGTEQMALRFRSHLDLALSTLSGYISLYIEVLFWSDEWELFSWSGLSTEITLMELPKTDLMLAGMK
jgi:hypothetical protein